MMTNKIHIRILYNNEEHNLITYKNEYRNLMLLIADKLCLDDFGQCKGEGRCGTCMIKILNKSYCKTEYSRNELNTILKFNNEINSLRLSCQLLINDEINGYEIKIVEAV